MKITGSEHLLGFRSFDIYWETILHVGRFRDHRLHSMRMSIIIVSRTINKEISFSRAEI